MSKTTCILALIGMALLITMWSASSILASSVIWALGIGGIAFVIPELIASRKKIVAALDKFPMFGER